MKEVPAEGEEVVVHRGSWYLSLVSNSAGKSKGCQYSAILLQCRLELSKNASKIHLYIRMTSRWWVAPESTSTTLASGDALKWEAGQGAWWPRLWTSSWRIHAWSLAHPWGRVLVPSCCLLSPNIAFRLQPKGCNNQNLVIAGCNVLMNWYVMLFIGKNRAKDYFKGNAWKCSLGFTLCFAGKLFSKSGGAEVIPLFKIQTGK